MEQQEKSLFNKMNTIARIPYDGQLPSSFFDIPERVYAGTTVRPAEDPGFTSSLFEIEARRNDIVIYTDHQHIRLTGIFPKEGGEAYFGFWECTANPELNLAAFDLLFKELKGRSYKRLVGPINFSTFHHYRLRTSKTPEWKMFDREPVNPDYYPEYLTQAGFKVMTTFESRMVTKVLMPDFFADKSRFLEAVSTIPFDFIPLNPENWRIYENEIYTLVHAIFSENPFYKAISEHQFKLIYNDKFARKLCPHSSVLFRDQASGRLACISMCQPNYHALYPDITTPEFHRDFDRLPHKTMLAKTIGVHPDFRRQGLLNYIGAYGMLALKTFYDDVIFCLMRSDNYSIHFSDRIPYHSVSYALYEHELAAD